MFGWICALGFAIDSTCCGTIVYHQSNNIILGQIRPTFMKNSPEKFHPATDIYQRCSIAIGSIEVVYLKAELIPQIKVSVQLVRGGGGGGGGPNGCCHIWFVYFKYVKQCLK